MRNEIQTFSPLFRDLYSSGFWVLDITISIVNFILHLLFYLKTTYMKIGILGSGPVGQTLAAAFLQEGNDVMLGSRNPQKEEVVKWKEKHSKGQTGTFAETAAFGELLVLATAGHAAESALELCGSSQLSGKVIIDATNPIAPAPPVNGVLKFTTTLDFSLMEKLQANYPQAKFVKAFNSVGNALMYKPKLTGGTPSMFICGNDAEAKKNVVSLLTSFGWKQENIFDLGDITNARGTEAFLLLWVRMFGVLQTPMFQIKIVK
jgi:predicted dinucleotide-binding enzyme